jgi:hypothetical protein
MNAQPSFEPPEQPRKRRKSRDSQPQQQVGTTQTAQMASPRQRTRLKLNPAYAHRRQGLEVVTKLVTYSTLSIFGMITLVNSIGYNWTQQAKLQHLETELQDAKLRTEKINNEFSRSFSPESQRNAIEENTYKIAPDRPQIVLVSPTDRPVLTPQSK